MARRLYAYDGEAGEDPHAVQLELNDDDARRWQELHADEDVGQYEFGTYIEVTDQTTGDRFNVATAPCGQGCHCAAVAVKIT